MAGQPLLGLARTVADPLPGAVEQVPDSRGVGQLGQVAGAAGHDVVQQQRLAVVGAALAGDWLAIGAISMWSGLSADLLAQAQQHRRAPGSASQIGRRG